MEQQTYQQMEQRHQADSSSEEEDIEVDEEFNDQCLEAHNRCRALHGCPPVSLSLELAASAQAWANHLASIGKLVHSTPNPRGKYGENIAMKMVSGSREYKGSQCTAQWYSEIEMYDFGGGENQMKCGHFSQVVWKATKEVGFGKAISPDGKMFAVGQYSPPGNFMNKWRVNIPAPVSGAIEVPAQEDIMGRPHGSSQQQQQQQQQPLSVTIGGKGGTVHQIGQGPGQGQVHLQVQGPQGDLEPQPTDPRDRPVGKATKTRIVNGEKTVTMTVTFARPDGSRYQLSKESSSQREAKQQQQQQQRPAAIDIEPEMIVRPTQFRRNFAAPPSASSATTVDGDDVGEFADKRAAFAEEATRLHNRLRRRHGAPELRRSESLERLAQAWADALSRSRDLRHSRPVAHGNGQVGQNIAKRPAAEAKQVSGGSGGGSQAAQQLLHQWYGEWQRFPFGQPDPEDISGGHFSQLVWCASEKLGVGLAVDRETGDEYAACFYYPCGNLAGEFADNVLPSYD